MIPSLDRFHGDIVPKRIEFFRVEFTQKKL